MKNLKVTVNGVEYNVQVEDMDETMLETSALQDTQPKAEVKSQLKPQPKESQKTKTFSPSSDAESINAPMPGTILSVNVSKGETVKAGKVLLILEAMKMENEIISPKDGIIESVNVSKGENVESGSPLVFIK